MYINCQLRMEGYRLRSDLDADKLACYMYGSKDQWEQLQRLEAECEKIGLGPNMAAPEMSRIDMMEQVQKNGELFKKITEIDFSKDHVHPSFIYMTNLQTKGGAGLIMSLHLIKVLGSQSQIDNWASKIASREWYTCYTQTELGHGSDVQNIKTMAVYDPKTEQFTIQTPDVDATKWWSSDLGVFATHAIVMTRIVSNGKDQGIFPLFIQIRDLDTHKVLSGLEVGDIGPKLGYQSKDNGFLRFHEFKAPKEALLSRFYKVDHEGNIKTVGNPKIIYASMLETRTILLELHTMAMFRALQIVARYSTIRKQFKDTEENEIAIMEYQMQKTKILKHLSRATALVFAKQKLMKFLKVNAEAVKNNNFSYLQEAHIYLSGYKAYFTWTGTRCFSDMIQAAGGHGYSLYSGLVGLLTEHTPDTILEGENTLLCLQVARHLLRGLQLAQAGKGDRLAGSTAYIKDYAAIMEYELPADRDGLCRHEAILQALARVACYFVCETAFVMMVHVHNGLDAKDVWNTRMGMRLLNIGKIHTVCSVAHEACLEIGKIEDERIMAVLQDVLLYYLIEITEEYSDKFIESNTITPDQISLLREKQEELVEQLSPHILKLCEGFQFSDRMLSSAIGHSNGQPYENLYQWAKQYGSLNRFAFEGHPAVHQYKL